MSQNIPVLVQCALFIDDVITSEPMATGVITSEPMAVGAVCYIAKFHMPEGMLRRAVLIGACYEFVPISSKFN